MSEPISDMASPSQPDVRIWAHEMLAAVKPPSQADLVELQQVASNLDRLLAAQSVDVDGLIDEFELARHPVRQSQIIRSE